MTDRPPYRPWDLGHAALFGLVLGSFFSVMEHLGFRAFLGWSGLNIVLYLGGRLLALALLFAAIALIRNVIAKKRQRRKAAT